MRGRFTSAVMGRIDDLLWISLALCAVLGFGGVAVGARGLFVAGVVLTGLTVLVRFLLRLDLDYDRIRVLPQRRLRSVLTRVPVQPIGGVDPTEVGIDAAAQADFPGEVVPVYLPREVDSELRVAINEAIRGGGPWIVVTTGGSKVGKSRTLFEALTACARHADLDFVAPVDAAALNELIDSWNGRDRRAILWLDDLEPFLSQGVTFQALSGWHARAGGVVAATFGGERAEPGRGFPGAPTTIAAEVFEHAREIQVGPTGSGELDPLRSQVSPDALGAIERHGLAAYLVAAPSLVMKLETATHAPGQDTCPEGVAVTRAAVDWARCGRRDPIPEATLRELWPGYLDAEPQPSNERFAIGLEWALRSVAGTISLLRRDEGGFRAYDFLVEQIENDPEAPAPKDVAWERAIKGASDAQALWVGSSAYRHGRFRNAATAFRAAAGSEVTELAGLASFNLGVTMVELGQLEEAVDVFDDVIRRFSGDPVLDDEAAGAMVSKGHVLVQLGRLQEAIPVLDEVLRRFDGSPEPALQEQVAKALLGKGLALAGDKRSEQAIGAYEEVLRRFGDTPEPALAKHVANALFSKGGELAELDRYNEAIASYEEIVARYGDAGQGALREVVGQALGNKGVALATIGRPDEAIIAYDDLIARYGDSDEPTLRRFVATGLYNNGLTLAALGKEEEAIKVFDDLIARYGEASDPELREMVERANAGRSLAAGARQRSEDIRAGDVEAIDRANLAASERLNTDAERNLRLPIRLTSLRFEGLDVFEDTDWELHRSINVLLGRNGYGKSLLLRMAAGMLQRDPEVTGALFSPGKSDGLIELHMNRAEKAEQIARDHSVFLRDSLSRVPLLAIPDARFMDRSDTTVVDPGSVNLAREGARHFLQQLPFQSAVEGLLSGLALDYWEHGQTFDLPVFNLIDEVLGRLSGRSLEFREIERVGRTGAKIWVRTEGIERDLEIQRASQGTLSVITVFGLIHAFLEELGEVRGARGEEEIRHQEAIVVIDEVDAHLHPVWQQKVRNLLVDIFPNVQFLLTAHSPLIVAGCSPGQVSVLRQGDAGYGVQRIDKDFVGATSQDLYREVFDVEDLDEIYLHYATQGKIGEAAEKDRELESLMEKERVTGLSDVERRLLEQLLDETGRIARVEAVRERRQAETMETVEKNSEIRRLKDELRQAQADTGGGDGGPV